MWSDGVVADTAPDAPGIDELVAFVRLACHGLRNPLAIATGMLELLDRLSGEQLDDDARDLLRRSSAAVDRTAAMVLSIQRHIGSRHRPLQLVPVELGEALALVVEQLDPAEVVVRVDGRLPQVVADPDMVEWVLHELVDNARSHAADEGPVDVVVDAVEDRGRWLVSVTDDGPGIPADRREEAFGEGERLERAGGGLGVGLTIVRTVLARHGGEAWLEDAPSGDGLRAVTAWPAIAPADPARR